MFRATCSVLLIAGCAASANAQEEGRFPGVKGLMNEQEYQETGLDKLTDTERQALDNWLIRYTAWQAPTLRQSNEEVKQVEREFELSASIKQPFKGWSDSTYFYLDNGQVWQQRNSGRYYYSGENTAVHIRKNALGFHVMELEATGKKVGVKRIK
jgi:hypothetical protein